MNFEPTRGSVRPTENVSMMDVTMIAEPPSPSPSLIEEQEVRLYEKEKEPEVMYKHGKVLLIIDWFRQ